MDEFDDPAVEDLLSSLPDVAMDVDTISSSIVAPPPSPPQQPDEYSDLSTEFDSDHSSEFNDPGFDQDLLAFIDDEADSKLGYRYGLEGRNRYRMERGPADLKPTDPKGSPVVPQTLCCPPPTDVDCVRVSPVSGFQSPDMRFGSGARNYMHKYLATHYTAYGPVDDEDDIAAFARTKAEREAAEEAYDCYEADGHVVDTVDMSDPTDSATARGAPSHQPSEADMPPQDDSPVGYGTDSWKTPSAYAEFSAKGSQVRKPPPVSRARLNLVALSQKYNLFFAAFKHEIHVFRPQQAPEIVCGALLVLCPQPTEAATLIGGYHSHTAPHQVNHIITGELGEVEILLIAYDDGDIFAYYTHRIVEYLAHKFRGHPTRSPPKPLPFFRESVGLSAWGLAIHSKSRLIAVSSNLAEVTVFAPSLCRPHTWYDNDYDKPFTVFNDYMSEHQDASFSDENGDRLLKNALRARSRNWRILLPVGQGGTNIPNIAFTSDRAGKAMWIVATDIDGYVIFLDIWTPNRHPLKMKVGQAKEMAAMGWGVLPILKSQLLKTACLPKRCPTVLSRSHGLMNHGLNYSAVTDPSTDAIITHPTEHYNVDKLDKRIIPRSAYTMRMLFELDCVQGGEFSAHSVSDYGSSDDEDEDDIFCGTSGFDYDEDWDVGLNESFSQGLELHDSMFPYFLNNPSDYSSPELLPRPRSGPRIRDLPFKAVDLQSGFFRSLIACPGISQTWPTSTLASLIRVLRMAMRHDSILSIPLPVTADHSRPKLRYRSPVVSQSSAASAATVTTAVAASEPETGTAGAILPLDHPPDNNGEDNDDDDNDDDEDDEDDEYDEDDDDDEDDSVTNDDAIFWPDLASIDRHYVIFQTLSNGAQMFSPYENTPIYQVDNITSFTADEPRRRPADMVDMSRPYSRHSMIHFIPEISLLVVGKMQGQVVLLRPLRNALDSGLHYIPVNDMARFRLHDSNYTPWAFRTEWTLPLQKDRTSEKYPLCCLLGIAVSPVPELGASRYGLKEDVEDWKYMRADGEKIPRPKKNGDVRQRWRLIMYYMDHTVLQYYIEESESGNEMCNVYPVLQEAQRASRQRQQADPSRPRYEDGIRV